MSPLFFRDCVHSDFPSMGCGFPCGSAIFASEQFVVPRQPLWQSQRAPGFVSPDSAAAEVRDHALRLIEISS